MKQVLIIVVSAAATYIICSFVFKEIYSSRTAPGERAQIECIQSLRERYNFDPKDLEVCLKFAQTSTRTK